MGLKSTGTWVIEAAEFKFDIISDLQGHLEVTMASEATNMFFWANMHMGFRVIELSDNKSDIKFNI